MKESMEQNPASIPVPQKNTDSPWTEGDIPTRKGNCNVLLIAPHGHPGDDKNTGKLTRKFADRLDCYAVMGRLAALRSGRAENVHR